MLLMSLIKYSSACAHDVSIGIIFQLASCELSDNGYDHTTIGNASNVFATVIIVAKFNVFVP